MKACDCLVLPDQLIKNRYLYTHYKKGGNCDNLCFFYALAKFLKSFQKTGIVQLAQKLQQEYKAFMKIEKFSGLKFSEIPQIEKMLKIRINIYVAEQNKQGKFFPKPFLLSNVPCSDSDLDKKTAMILFYKDHAILIKKIFTTHLKLYYAHCVIEIFPEWLIFSDRGKFAEKFQKVPLLQKFNILMVYGSPKNNF